MLFVVVVFGGFVASAIWKRSWGIACSGLLLIFLGLGLAIVLATSMSKNAVQVAASRPYCLALASLHRPVQSNLDLTLLFAKGDRLSPHMMLWVEQGDAIEAYSWSYWQQRFLPGLPMGVLRNCHPRTDFLATLTPAAPGMHVSLGPSDYVIPPEYSPDHVDDTYISLNFTPESALNRGHDSVEWGEKSIGHWQTSDAQSRTFAPKEAARVRSDGPYGFIIRDFDGHGQLVQIFSCNSAKFCGLEFFSVPFLFNVYLPPTDPDDVAKIRQRIESLWYSFRQ